MREFSARKTMNRAVIRASAAACCRQVAVESVLSIGPRTAGEAREADQGEQQRRLCQAEKLHLAAHPMPSKLEPVSRPPAP
jgi:hypothetical protein